MFDNNTCLKVAITGGIACGKSEALKVIASMGIPVLDADDIVHRIYSKDTHVYQEIVKLFGKDILDSDGEINRKNLSDIIFLNADNDKQRIENIVHPEVKKEFVNWIDEHKDDKMIVGVIPLLFEAGFDNMWDFIVCIIANEQTIVKRLQKRGLTSGAAKERLSYQYPIDQKARKSDLILSSDCSLNIFEERIKYYFDIDRMLKLASTTS